MRRIIGLTSTMPFSIRNFVEKNCQFLSFILSSSPSSLSCSRPCRWPPSYTGISPVVQFDYNFDIDVDLENKSQLNLWDCSTDNWSHYEKPNLPTGNFAHIDRVNYDIDYVSFWKRIASLFSENMLLPKEFPWWKPAYLRSVPLWWWPGGEERSQEASSSPQWSALA